jgi:hypothetical protein
MKASSKTSDYFFFVAVHAWILGVFTYDLTHPEIWCDWKHDPRWYWPLLVVYFLILALICRQSWRRRKRDARLLSMILAVEELFKAGRRDEGERAYSLYHRVEAAKSKREEDVLAKQFSDLVSNSTQKGLLP